MNLSSIVFDFLEDCHNILSSDEVNSIRRQGNFDSIDKERLAQLLALINDWIKSRDKFEAEQLSCIILFKRTLAQALKP